MTKGRANFCLVHLKMYRAKVENMFGKIYTRLHQAGRWDAFLKQLRKQVEEDDHYSVLVDRFDDLLFKFKIRLSRAQKFMLLKTVPAPSTSG